MTRGSVAANQIDRLTAMRHYPHETWMADGACVGINPDMWFPTEQSDGVEAIEVCCQCPVQDECGAYAVRNRIRYGIWGGLTEADRRRIWKSKGAA